MIEVDYLEDNDGDLHLPDHKTPNKKKDDKDVGAHQGTIYDEDNESQSDIDDNQLKKGKRGKIKKKRHGGNASEKFTTSVGRHTKRGAHKGIRKRIISQDSENGQDFYEPLSYKKLSKKIEIHHPCDPDTKKKL